MRLTMPKRRRTSAIERDGVNYVRTIIENANSIFNEIHRENDYGNDGFIELVDGERVTGKLLLVQIKSGKTYNDSTPQTYGLLTTVTLLPPLKTKPAVEQVKKTS
jgi:hypothetical protein